MKNLFRMRTHILEIDYSDQFDFELVGLRSSEKDFRVAWALNRSLGWSLERKKDIEIESEPGNGIFSRFDYEHEDDQTIISLIQNRSEYGWILPEWPQFDYLLKIDNDQWGKDAFFYRKLRDVPFIGAAFPLGMDKLKSKHNLIFWEYASTDKRRNEENENSGNDRPGLGF